MSKSAKKIVLFLILIVVAAVGYSAYLLLIDIPTLQGEKSVLEVELSESQKMVNDLKSQFSKKQKEVEDLTKENEKLDERLRKAEARASELQGQVTSLTDERDKFKSRIENVKRERDELMQKMQNFNRQKQSLEEQVASYRQQVEDLKSNGVSAQPAQAAPVKTAQSGFGPSISAGSSRATDDEYWADVIKQKAALEVQIEALKSELSTSAVEIVDLQQENADLQLEIDSLKQEAMDMGRDIKYKVDMINNLSVELARSRNDNKYVNDQLGKINEENRDLRGQIKTLVNSKSALEKSIVKITEDKNDMKRKLAGTEGLIQSKIDEIWEIKQSIDDTFDRVKVDPDDAEVELPPIVVSSDAPAVNYNPGDADIGFNGKVVSLNEENNFAIVDVGQSSGVRLGDVLSVYRDAKYIARLEVIQVRDDISAADIKDQWSRIKVGDVVR